MTVSTDVSTDLSTEAKTQATTPAATGVAALLAGLPALTGQLAAGAAGREAERELPYASMDLVRRSGLGALRVPVRHGGPGARLADLFQVVIDIAAADSNVAQSLRPHFGFVEKLISRADEADRERWFGAALDGALFGNATGERDTAHPGQIRTALTHDTGRPGGYRLNGVKYYSTGSLFADFVVVAAVDEEERRVRAVLPRDRAGLKLVDDWDGMGQRMTASGTTVLDDVAVRADEVAVEWVTRDRRTHLGAFHQLFLVAVQAGIVKDVLRDAVSYARGDARAVQHSGVEHATRDPLVQQAVGEIAAAAYSAEATVLRAAGAIDEAIGETAPDGVAGSDEALREAIVQVAQAQAFVSPASVRATERIFDVGGASATLREYNFDRHWRNARTLASHNPTAHKARAVGDFLLNDEGPPLTGFF